MAGHWHFGKLSGGWYVLFILHSSFQSIYVKLKAHVTPSVKRAPFHHSPWMKKTVCPACFLVKGFTKKNRTEVSAVAIFAFKWCARGVLLLNAVHHLLSFCRGNDEGISGWSRKAKARHREPVFNYYKRVKAYDRARNHQVKITVGWKTSF